MMTAVRATDTMLLAKGGGWITVFVIGEERVVGAIANRKCVIHDSLISYPKKGGIMIKDPQETRTEEYELTRRYPQ